MMPLPAARSVARLCCALLLCGLPSAVPAAGDAPLPLATLSPFTAGYEVRLNNLPFKARATQSLVPLGGDRWRLELNLESLLLDTVERADFRWDGANCHAIPEHYHYLRQGVGRDRRLDLRFDFANRVAVRNDGRKTSTFPISERTEDKLGHTLALACRIARGARGDLAVDVAWDKQVQHFDYRVAAGEESVVTPSGTWRAIRFERKRVDSDRVTMSWIAADANWQAVKMQHTEGDGNLLQLRLLRFDPAGSHAAPR
ncbi:MAG: DUF3108 domain-containing protein [Pseudomonadota bacterium]